MEFIVDQSADSRLDLAQTKAARAHRQLERRTGRASPSAPTRQDGASLTYINCESHGARRLIKIRGLLVTPVEGNPMAVSNKNMIRKEALK